MPEMILIGWVHLIIAIVALIAGFFTLAKYKLILVENTSGKIYLAFTFLAAGTALMIYNQGGFGPAHMLAILTLLALAAGYLADKIPFMSKVADYFRALCYTVTLLFHMIPAITDGLLRLPIGDPFLDSFHDPLLKKFYLLFLVLFVIGYACQVVFIKRSKA